MRDLFVERRMVQGEDEIPRYFDYYITIGEMKLEGIFSCESYGVKVVEQNGDTVAIPNVTVSISRIDGLMELLTRNTVGPTALGDVVADWL